MKTAELTRLLQKNGCYLYRNGSNHDIWFSPITRKQFAVPRHKKEVKPGTARNILKDAGIDASSRL